MKSADKTVRIDRNKGDKLRKSILIYVAIAVMLSVLLAIGTRLIAPAPPRTLNFASGAPEGAYSLTAEAYEKVFVDQDLTFNIIHSTGSGDNLRMLRSGEVSAAIVQGGVASDEDKRDLVSLGAIFFEPLWVFYRKDSLPGQELTDDIRNVGNLRIAAGSETSGTRKLVTEILADNGITTELLALSGTEGANAIKAGTIDVLAAVSAPRAPFIRDLLADPTIAV